MTYPCSVRLATCGIVQVLVELRQWGGNQNAISAVYKALVRTENLDSGIRGPGTVRLIVYSTNNNNVELNNELQSFHVNFSVL